VVSQGTGKFSDKYENDKKSQPKTKQRKPETILIEHYAGE